MIEEETKAAGGPTPPLPQGDPGGRPRLGRAVSVSQLMAKKYKTFALGDAWRAAFGEPETTGVWFIWGQSGSGKTSFVLSLCKELTRFGRVLYNSLEEGTSLTMRNAISRVGMAEVKQRFLLLSEPMDELDLRLRRHKSAPIVVIDSYQYTGMSYSAYLRFKRAHSDKLLIFISQCDGRNPSGRTAKSVMYDASLKIWVEGYRAISKGRYFGDVGYYDIWPERAEKYWGVADL